jgi:hypothetical protein
MSAIRNIDRFRKDLARLQETAEQLELAFLLQIHGEAELAKALEVEAGSEKIKTLPKFSWEYESWYSEAIALVRQLLPDRLQDFREHFEAPKSRKELTFTTYRIQDALKGTQVTRNGSVIVNHSAALPHFVQQAAILRAVERRFDSSLFDIRQIVQADLFDDEIEAARELLKNNFTRAAGAVAGVVLEKHLRQVCDDHSVKIAKKNPGISDLNDLLKSASVIDMPQWRFISMLGDIRNLCDHNKSVEPSREQVTDLLDGTSKVLKTIF